MGPRDISKGQNCPANCANYMLVGFTLPLICKLVVQVVVHVFVVMPMLYSIMVKGRDANLMLKKAIRVTRYRRARLVADCMMPLTVSALRFQRGRHFLEYAAI
eukprot:6195409-Pleurochrysis_carterae.AAC.2